MIRVGVDVGGTFTDIVLECSGPRGRQSIFVHKVSSTPEDQSVGVVKGIVEVCKIAGVAPADVDVVFHGTTVATNMVIERKGAEVGMITTRGFRDILEKTLRLGRDNRGTVGLIEVVECHRDPAALLPSHLVGARTRGPRLRTGNLPGQR